MISFSWQYDFKGAARTWAVSTIFCLTGVFCGFVLPFILVPQAPAGSVRADGTVVRMETVDGMERPVFRFSDRSGELREFASGIWSSRSGYGTGERVTVVFDMADPSVAFVQDDKDLAVALWILRVVAVVFGGIGLAILGMKLKGMDDEVISRIGGLIGALSYAVPASLVLPGLWFAYRQRPNWLFAADATFGLEQWLIGSIFSATGVLAFVATVALYRYQARTGKTGWYWHRDRSSNKKS